MNKRPALCGTHSAAAPATEEIPRDSESAPQRVVRSTSCGIICATENRASERSELRGRSPVLKITPLCKQPVAKQAFLEVAAGRRNSADHFSTAFALPAASTQGVLLVAARRGELCGDSPKRF